MTKNELCYGYRVEPAFHQSPSAGRTWSITADPLPVVCRPQMPEGHAQYRGRNKMTYPIYGTKRRGCKSQTGARLLKEPYLAFLTDASKKLMIPLTEEERKPDPERLLVVRGKSKEVVRADFDRDSRTVSF